MRLGRHLTGIAVALLSAGAATVSVAETCQLRVQSSVDAVRAELRYFTDSSGLQALLVTHHAYEDGDTMITVIPLLCDGDQTGPCTGTVVEDFGDERSFWFTRLTRQGDLVTAFHRGASDIAMNDVFEDGEYTDVFRVVACTAPEPGNGK